MNDRIKTGRRKSLRERFMKGESTVQTDETLLELLLTYAIPRKDVKPLAKELINEFGSLSNVLAADINTLCKFRGIQNNSAVLLKLTDWIRSRYITKKVEQIPLSATDDKQASLFDLPLYTQREPIPEKRVETVRQKRGIARRGTGLFGKSVLKEAITLLPSLPDTHSVDEIREYLRKSLHYSGEQTRQRCANYIIRRMFPDGHPDGAIRLFAKHFRRSRSLQEVCFYRFIKAEPLMQEVAKELLLPSLGNGWLNRTKVRDYLSGRFPSSRSIKDSAQAIVDALGAGGIANVDHRKITFGYRDIPIPAFAFVLHSEFSEPGMYDILKLESSHAIKAMLWNPDRILPCLYELRNRGLISKVSEIDNIRQFTIKWNLDQLVENLIDTKNRK